VKTAEYRWTTACQLEQCADIASGYLFAVMCSNEDTRILASRCTTAVVVVSQFAPFREAQVLIVFLFIDVGVSCQ
jgi:hypothetical protein